MFKDGFANKLLIELKTPVGYMQLNEYVLPDYSYLHVVTWHHHFAEVKSGLDLDVQNYTYFRDKNSAIAKAVEVSNYLLNFDTKNENTL